ncbi:MAG: hypothetical protein AVDCRST_MAG45-507 [uncultured Solirubrobacterales bacterium]|uniref:Uncharacterized protein n=1 Tax=uncultured Solirubrobacterales bacterium TaxID=768556 RepID=A0A6J4S200_9ACTN|nr:MAG: hypothetical protein AVDCRST_MAG45-507 [uncultured Solirubrobacterales bacterium]
MDAVSGRIGLPLAAALPGRRRRAVLGLAIVLLVGLAALTAYLGPGLGKGRSTSSSTGASTAP